MSFQDEVEVKVMGMGVEEFLRLCKERGYHPYKGGSYYIRDEYWKHTYSDYDNVLIRLRVSECDKDSSDVVVDLTIKGEDTGGDIINREEIVLDIGDGDVESARKFLERLGYRQQDVIKKARRTWNGIAAKDVFQMVHDCYVVFDKLDGSENCWMEFEFCGVDAEECLDAFLKDFGLKGDKRLSTEKTRDIAATR